MHHSPYLEFSRRDWGRLRADTPLTLTEEELEELQGQTVNVSMQEVVEIYLPLSRLLNLYVAATQRLYQATARFLASPVAKVPYIIGLGGSVAVGKSTTSRVLQALLSRWPDHPHVALVTTDGFLFPNRELEARGLMRRKGFPESFDLPSLVRFISDIKGGRAETEIPVYSHHEYDIIPGRVARIFRPDIMIVEGLNVLQSAGDATHGNPSVFISDFFDFSIYVHAETPVVRQWYLERFLKFRQAALEDPSSFYARFNAMSDQEVKEIAERTWSEINEVNLLRNILPTRERSRLILEKNPDHSVHSVKLRKL